MWQKTIWWKLNRCTKCGSFLTVYGDDWLHPVVYCSICNKAK